MAPPYNKSVFINCPFDTLFEPLFHAIVLTIAARGFVPRCARETEGQADPRIIRIARRLLQCKYSIHDLSRFQGEGPDNLSRFNMPLELGMALGIRYLRGGEDQPDSSPKEHNWVALVPEGFVHQKFISDLGGYDASDHDEQPATVIKCVARWLSLQPDFSSPAPPAKKIVEAYGDYCKLIKKSEEEELSITWPAILRSAEKIVTQIG